MKLSLMSFIACCLTVRGVAQGTIEFVNLDVGFGVNAPVYQVDGTTKLAGSQFMAELLVGSTSASLASIATTGFLTGSSAGYFNDGTQSLLNIPVGRTAWVEVQVWNTASGTSFLQARASGLPNSWWQSSVFTVVLGGGTINPSPPAALTGLGNSPVYLNSVPEPSVLGLLGLGAAAALSRNRRRQKSKGSRKTIPLLLCFVLRCASVQAQGTLLFQNLLLQVGLNAPVYQSDGVTPLSGPQFMAELLAGSSADNLALIATTGFLSGAGAGYFVGGSAAANVAPGADAWVQVNVWNTASGSSFALAKASGLPNSWWQSPIFTARTGNPNPTPTPPGPLIGLGNSPVYLNSVPEPCAFAFVLLGGALMLLRKRLEIR